MIHWVLNTINEDNKRLRSWGGGSDRRDGHYFQFSNLPLAGGPHDRPQTLTGLLSPFNQGKLCRIIIRLEGRLQQEALLWVGVNDNDSADKNRRTEESGICRDTLIFNQKFPVSFFLLTLSVGSHSDPRACPSSPINTKSWKPFTVKAKYWSTYKKRHLDVCLTNIRNTIS